MIMLMFVVFLVAFCQKRITRRENILFSFTEILETAMGTQGPKPT